MAYSKKFHGRSNLDNMQDERDDLEGDANLVKEAQVRIDNYFFGPPGRRKTKKERKKDLKRERMKNTREEEY